MWVATPQNPQLRLFPESHSYRLANSPPLSHNLRQPETRTSFPKTQTHTPASPIPFPAPQPSARPPLISGRPHSQSASCSSFSSPSFPTRPAIRPPGYGDPIGSRDPPGYRDLPGCLDLPDTRPAYRLLHVHNCAASNTSPARYLSSEAASGSSGSSPPGGNPNTDFGFPVLRPRARLC